MEMFLLVLFGLGLMPSCYSLRCPSSCSFISPVPYPFGAASGCGAPGFQISNCSATPQWNLILSETASVYYIRSIHPLPNSDNRSLGYGGYIILSLSPVSSTPFCEVGAPRYPMTALSSSNLYAFESANLTFSENKYLLFNCTGSTAQVPGSGIFTPSSSACKNYLQHCNHSLVGQCLEYAPYKDLYLPTLLNAYNCSSFRRFIIAHEDDAFETWITGAKFAWGPVKDVDSCAKCQSSGGTCGYTTADKSFLCICGDDVDALACSDGQSGKKRVTIIASIAAGSVVALACLILCFLYRHHYWWAFKKCKHQDKLDSVHQGPVDFPYRDLIAATKNFNTEIGHGAFGKVYRGRLSDGSEIAVKVLDPCLSHSTDQFLNEVATIGNIHHVNVARLVGFCFSKSKKILVYEFVRNGSLDKYLFSSSSLASHDILNWKQRFEIALGIARGLSYMHDECRSCIVHCDIKPQNILLDTSFCPKIADFGLAKLLTREESRVLTQVRGTPGYVAPEFWAGSGPLSAKFDVYSYGMMLLEIVRGKRSFRQFDPFSLEASDEEVNDWGSLSVDARVIDDADLEQVRICTQVAMWCIQEVPSLRPTMSKVVQYLQGTAEVPVDVPVPFKNLYRHQNTESQEKLFSSMSSKEV